MEYIVWKQKASHWIYFVPYAISMAFTAGIVGASIYLDKTLLLTALGLPIIIVCLFALKAETTEYTLTNERLRIKSGVLSKLHTECELYRIHDYLLEEPLLYRVFGLSTVILHTTDTTHDTIKIEAIKQGEKLLDDIRALVEYRRRGIVAPLIDYTSAQ